MDTGLTKKNKNLLNALKKKYSTDTDLVVLVDTFLERTDGLSQVFAKGLLESAKLTRGTAKGVVKSKLQEIIKEIGEPEPPPMTPATEPATTPVPEIPMTPMTPVGGAAGAGAGDVPKEPLGGGVGGEMGFSDKTLAKLNTLMEKLNKFEPQLKGGENAKQNVIGFLSALLLRQGTIPRTVAEKAMDKYRTSIFVKDATPASVIEGISSLTDELMKVSPKPKDTPADTPADTPSEPAEPPMEPAPAPAPAPEPSPAPAPAPEEEEEKEEQRSPDTAPKAVKTLTENKTPSGKVVDIDIDRVPTKIELIPKERLSAEDKSIKQLQDDIDYFYREFKEKLKNIRKTKSNNLSILKRFHKRITGLLGGNLDLSKDDTDKKTMGVVIKGSEFIKEKLKEIILESSIDGLSAQDLLINISDESTGDKSKDAGQYQFKTNKISGKTYANGEPVYRYILNEDPEQTDKQSAVYKQPIHKIPNPKTMFRSQVITSRKAVANNPFINANQPTIRLKSIY